MPYTPHDWTNDSGPPYLSATYLNEMEDGIGSAVQMGEFGADTTSVLSVDVGPQAGASNALRGIVNPIWHDNAFASFHRPITTEPANGLNAIITGSGYASYASPAVANVMVGVLGNVRSDVVNASLGEADAHMSAIGLWGNSQLQGGVANQFGMGWGVIGEARTVAAATFTATATKGSDTLTDVSFVSESYTSGDYDDLEAGQYIGELNGDVVYDNTTILDWDDVAHTVQMSAPAKWDLEYGAFTANGDDGQLFGGEFAVYNYGGVSNDGLALTSAKGPLHLGAPGSAPVSAFITTTGRRAAALNGVLMRQVTGTFYKAEIPERGGAVGMEIVNNYSTYDGDLDGTDTVTNLALTATYTGTTANGDATVTHMNRTTQLQKGMAVSGSGIQAGTTIADIDDAAATIELSLPATASASGVTLTIGPITSVEIQVGTRVLGTGIQANTFVKEVVSGTSITLSRPAVATAAGQSLDFTHWRSGLVLPYGVPLSGRSRDVALNGTLAKNQATVTGLSSTAALSEGMHVRGSGILTGAFILSVDSSSQVTLSTRSLKSGATALRFTKEYDLIRLNGTAVEVGGPDVSEVALPNNVEIAGLSADGSTTYTIARVDTGDAVRIGDAQPTRIVSDGVTVVGSRRTGWTAWTGTGSRSTHDTATVTLAQVAGAVKSMLDDLIAHGLLGT